MTNVIMDTGNVAEMLGLGPEDEISNMEATAEPTGHGIEFHVSMRGYTMRDMEELIVHAAAQQIIKHHNDAQIAKQIEAKCIELVTTKANSALEKITAEIIDQPIIPKYSYGKPDAAPVTMREFIGLTGRQYLSERVDDYGKVNERGSYNEKSRIQYLVEQAMARTFKNEIEKATNAVIAEIRSGIAAQHKAFLEGEKARFREALAKTVK